MLAYRYYHKHFAKLVEISESKIYLKHLGENDESVKMVLDILLRRMISLGKSINILLTSGQIEDAAILARTLLETSWRYGYIILEKKDAKTKSAAYLTDQEYKTKIIKDIEQYGIDGFDAIDAKKTIDDERKAILEFIDVTESDIKGWKSVQRIADLLKMWQVYSLHYRMFSQFVHSKPLILESLIPEKQAILFEDVLLNSTLVWSYIITCINEFFELDRGKDVKAAQKDFRSIIRNHSKKYWNQE